MHPPGKEVTAYIGMGSNLGERRQNLTKAREKIAALPGVRVGRSSSFYETEPVGHAEQGKFINSVLEIHTRLEAPVLLEKLLEIEASLKRERLVRFGPRTLDLDLLFYGEEVISREELTVPHPRLHQRAFVLVPLAELAPALVHPGTGKTVEEHLAERKEARGVEKLKPEE